MGQILAILKLDLVFEVMLNVDMCEDAAYKGHIWYKKSGVGMKRLINEIRNTILHLCFIQIPPPGCGGWQRECNVVVRGLEYVSKTIL